MAKIKTITNSNLVYYTALYALEKIQNKKADGSILVFNFIVKKKTEITIGIRRKIKGAIERTLLYDIQQCHRNTLNTCLNVLG